MVGAALSEHVDGGGRHPERGVVPGEGDVVADLVVFGRCGSWRDHVDTAWREARVEGLGCFVVVVAVVAVFFIIVILVIILVILVILVIFIILIFVFSIVFIALVLVIVLIVLVILIV